MIRALFLVLFTVTAFGLTGCEGFKNWWEDVPEVDTPLKAWAVAQDTLTAANVAAANLMDEDKLSLEDAGSFVAFSGRAQAHLDDAKALIDSGAGDKAKELIDKAMALISEAEEVLE